MSEFLPAPYLIDAAQQVLLKFSAGTKTATKGPDVDDAGLRGSVLFEDLPQQLQKRLEPLLSPAIQDQRICQLYHGRCEKYGGQSEADLAFCGLLSAKGFTAPEVDLTLRASHLYRKKWDRDSYRRRTLKMAFANVRTEGGAPPSWVETLNQRYALVNIGSDVVVADTRAPSTCGDHGFQVKFLKLTAFKALLAGRYVQEDASNKKQPLAEAWLCHPQRVMFDGVEFAPDGSTSPQLMNLWKGFQVRSTLGDVKPWLETLNRLVPKPYDREYVIKWLAFKVQHPGAVSEVVLIFQGLKGAGKNSLIEPVLRQFGPHGMVADDAESVFGRFNGHMLDKAFVVLDEAVFAADAKLADRIKARVTGRSLMYEFKGMTPVMGVNRCAYVMLTNHEHVWRASHDERRAAIIETSGALRGERAHWSAFYAWCDGPGPAALLHYLLNIDLAGFHPRHYSHTAAMSEQIRQTALRDPLHAWWYLILESGEVPSSPYHTPVISLNESGCTEVPTATLQASYEHAAKSWPRPLPWASAMKTIRRWSAEKITVHRPNTGGTAGRLRYYLLPPIQDLREAFHAATGIEVVDVQAVQAVQAVQDD